MGAEDEANYAKYFPKDLDKNQSKGTGQDYFTIPILNLKPGTPYAFNFQWVFPDGTKSKWSDGYTVTAASYATKLTTPTITVTPAALGYTVSYTAQTDKNFDNAIIEEAVSTSNTAPSSGYQQVGVTSSNPITITIGNVLKRWVRIKLTDKIAGNTAYSNIVAVTPVDPVAGAIDVTPPDEVTITSAQWVTSGLTEEIQIAYTIPTNGGSEFQIFLTNGAKTRSISEYPTNTGTSQIARISKVQLEGLFGVDYPTSFTGLFKSIDKAKNTSAGTAFTVSAKGNALVGITPTVTATAMINGFSISWDLGSAKTAKVYTSTTSGFTPNESNAPQYYGAGPYIQNTSLTSGFSTVYFKVKFFGDTATDFSGFSAEGSVTPINPDNTDTTPPLNSTATAAWNGNSIEITPTFASGEDSIRCIIELTAGGQTRPFLRWKTELVSGKFTITQDELYSAFGLYYTAFAGVFKTADTAGNTNTGTSFNVASKTNPLTGVVPTFALTAITNGYTATWTLPVAASYAKVYESATSWGAGNPTESDLIFSGSSPAIIKKTVYTLRYVKIKYITVDGFESSWSAESTVTPIDAISADVVAPSAPSTISATAGTDSTGTIGFNGVVNISWATVLDTTLRGYRIRFRPYKASAPFENYSYVDSPGTATTYRLAGLALGTTYEVGIASYDEFNNTSSAYTALSPNIAVSGTPFVGTNVSTTGYFEAGVSGTDTGTFKFGYGVDTGKRGLVLNPNNYWYIDSAQSALFKIGGASNNYVSWNGTKLFVDGDLGVAGGTTIGGNIAMGTSGASIYQGTLTGGSLTSDGFILNSSGLSIKKGSVNLRLDTNDGGIYAEYGQIAGWTIDSAKIERLTSSKYTGISSSGNYAFYAGATASGNSGGDSSAEFWVKPDGTAKAGSIRITGGSLTVGANFDVTSTGVLTATNGKFNGEITAASGTITGNFGVTTGTIFAGAAATGVNRVVMNQGGLFGYKNTAGVDTINFSFPNDTGLFTLGSGDISGWSVSSGNIEKITGSTYSGISTGTYAFYAGGGSAGSGSPKFKVTQAGVMTAEGVQINGGSLDVGPAWPTGGFHVNTSGVLQAKGATIAGALTIEGGSTFAGNIEVTSGGTIFMGSTNANTNRVVLTSAGISGYAASAPIFTLNTSGTGTIGGWNFNATSLSSAGMELNSGSQTISFTSGFIIDNDNFTYNVAGGTQASSTYYGSDTNTDGVVQDSFVSSAPGTAVASSIRIKPSSSYNATTSPALVMSTTGYSTLQGGGSYISLGSTGVVINTNTTGGIVLKGFASAYHAMYTGTSSSGPGPKEAGAVLQIFSDGRVTAGRAFYRSGASETSITNINHGTWPYVGLIGDVIFSTAD
jgi:hypothetical protein